MLYWNFVIFFETYFEILMKLIAVLEIVKFPNPTPEAKGRQDKISPKS